MTRKQQRITAILIITLGAALAIGLSLFALRENVTYFYTPTDIYEGAELPKPGHAFRLGGLVEKHSIQRNGTLTSFIVSDLKYSMPVHYEGILPDLFREGQGVIATGTIDDEAIFIATSLLAKHDENYMPPDVAKALKEQEEQKIIIPEYP